MDSTWMARMSPVNEESNARPYLGASGFPVGEIS